LGTNPLALDYHREKIRPYLESMGIRALDLRTKSPKVFLKMLHKKHFNPLAIAKDYFKRKLNTLGYRQNVAKTKLDKIKKKLDQLFKTLAKRSIYGEGFIDSLFTEIALSLFSLYPSQASKIIVRGDFVNGRGLMKSLKVLEPEKDDLLVTNSFLEKVAQSARKKLLDYLQSKGLPRNSVQFFASPGDEMLILIDSVPEEPDFYQEFQAKLDQINRELKAEAAASGLMELEHFKDKNPPQQGFGLVLKSKLIKGGENFNIEKVLDETDKDISEFKKAEYATDPAQRPKIKRSDILRKNLDRSAVEEIRSRNTLEEQPEFSSSETFRIYRDINQIFQALTPKQSFQRFLDSLDAFIRLENPETKTRPLWDLEEFYKEHEKSLESRIETRPRLLSLWACGLASLNQISRSLGQAFVKKVSEIIRKGLGDLGYSEQQINRSIFNRSAANFEIIPGITRNLISYRS
jgi:hypothetical protein